MKRLLLGSLAISLIGAAGILGWLWVAPTPHVTVALVNRSRQPIEWVKLSHEGGVITARHISVGERRTVTFPARGETTYSLWIRFSDGTELKGAGQYAESGYRITETVTDSKVSSEFKVLSY